MRYDELAAQLETARGIKSQQEIAAFFGVKQPAVASWKAKDKIPALRIAELELMKLKEAAQ